MFIHKKPNEPKMVYLDQNKWIELSLAYYQNPRGMRFTSVLQQIQTAVKQNFARFPFSDTHIMESMKMGDISRRQRLAQVMAELSLGWSIAPKGNVTSQELGPALSVAFHEPAHLVSPHVFGQGVEFAFGQPLHVPEFLKSLNSSNEAKKKLSIQALATLLCAPDETLRKPAIDKYNAIANEIANSVDQIRNLVRNESRDLRHRAYMGRQLYDDLKDQSNELYIGLSQLGYTFEDFLNLGKERIKSSIMMFLH